MLPVVKSERTSGYQILHDGGRDGLQAGILFAVAVTMAWPGVSLADEVCPLPDNEPSIFPVRGQLAF